MFSIYPFSFFMILSSFESSSYLVVTSSTKNIFLFSLGNGLWNENILVLDGRPIESLYSSRGVSVPEIWNEEKHSLTTPVIRLGSRQYISSAGFEVIILT